MEKVRNVDNEVSISGILIYNSNDEKVIPLIKESLDLICYYYFNDDIYYWFEKVYYAVSYVNPKEENNCSK